LVSISLVVLLVACGGKKKDDSSSSSGGDSSSSSSQSSGSGSSGSSSSSSSDADISLENCKAYASLETAATSAFGTSSSGQIKVDKDALNKLVKASPNEIKADMQVLVDALVGYVEAVNKLGVNLNDPQAIAKMDPSKLQELQKLSEKFDDKKLTDASDRVEAYFTKHCS
jgi:hypothetical protein